MIRGIESTTQNGGLTNAAKFGMAGFGITLVLLGFAFAGVIAFNSVVLATVLTLGVVAPLIAGVLEFCKGNSYLATATVLFSLLFLTFYIFTTRTFGFAASDGMTRGIFYAAWSLVTILILCGTFARRMDVGMTMLLIVLTLFALFTLFLTAASFTGIAVLTTIAGILAIATAAAIFVDFCLHICCRMNNSMEKLAQ